MLVEAMTLFSNQMLRKLAEDPRTLSATEMCGPQLRPLIINTSSRFDRSSLSTFTCYIHISCLLNVFFTQSSFQHFVSSPKSKHGRENLNMLRDEDWRLERRCLNYGDRDSTTSTTKLTELISRKGMYSQMSSADTVDYLTYNTLTTTWRKARETGLQTFPTRRPCTLTFTIKSMTCCAISSAHPAVASDMSGQTSLSCLSSTNDSPV